MARQRQLTTSLASPPTLAEPSPLMSPGARRLREDVVRHATGGLARALDLPEPPTPEGPVARAGPGLSAAAPSVAAPSVAAPAPEARPPLIHRLAAGLPAGSDTPGVPPFATRAGRATASPVTGETPTGAGGRPLGGAAAARGPLSTPAGLAGRPTPHLAVSPPAAPHLARGIVRRLADRPAATSPFSFERRLDGGSPPGDPLAVGAIRLPTPDHSVAPSVVWRRRIDGGSSTGLSSIEYPRAPTAEDLLQWTQAPFSPSSGDQSPDSMESLRFDPSVPDPNHPRPGDPPIIRQLSISQPASYEFGGHSVYPSPGPVDQSPAPVDEETLEWIIEAVEARVLEELERRGMRYNPGVF